MFEDSLKPLALRVPRIAPEQHFVNPTTLIYNECQDPAGIHILSCSLLLSSTVSCLTVGPGRCNYLETFVPEMLLCRSGINAQQMFPWLLRLIQITFIWSVTSVSLVWIIFLENNGALYHYQQQLFIIGQFCRHTLQACSACFLKHR